MYLQDTIHVFSNYPYIDSRKKTLWHCDINMTDTLYDRLSG